MRENILESFLTNEEIKGIKEVSVKDRRHPVIQLLQPRNGNIQARTNTNCALNRIINHDKPWLESIRNRLTNIDEFSAASSCLGEIRAYGYLLDTSLEVQHIPEANTPTPDFIITHGKEKVIVEVNSKQYDNVEERSLERFNNELMNVSNNNTDLASIK